MMMMMMMMMQWIEKIDWMIVCGVKHIEDERLFNPKYEQEHASYLAVVDSLLTRVVLLGLVNSLSDMALNMIVAAAVALRVCCVLFFGEKCDCAKCAI